VRDLIRRLYEGEDLAPAPVYPYRASAEELEKVARFFVGAPPLPPRRNPLYLIAPTGHVPPGCTGKAYSPRDWMLPFLGRLELALASALGECEEGRLAAALRLVGKQLRLLVLELGRTASGLKAEIARATGPNATRLGNARTRAAAIERELERLRLAWPKANTLKRAEKLCNALLASRELRLELLGNKPVPTPEGLLERLYRSRRRSRRHVSPKRR